jgi:hypothetical protein
VRAGDLIGYKRATPFQPFRIVMNDGHSYDVRHPDLVDVGHRVGIFFYRRKPKGPFDRWETFSLTLISRIVSIEREDPPPGESKRKRKGA